TSIGIKENNGAIVEQSTSIKAKTLVNTEIGFETSGSITFQVSARNQGTTDAKLMEIKGLEESNAKEPSCIQVSVEDHNIGEVIYPNQIKNFTITITSTCTSYFSKEFDLHFIYEKQHTVDGEVTDEYLKELFLIQAQNVVKEMEDNFKEGQETKEYNFPNDQITTNTSEILGGYSTIDKDGDSAIAVYDQKSRWCAVKTKGETELRVIDNYLKCDKDIAENLIINGYGEYGDNTNFSFFTYSPSGYFSYAGAKWGIAIDGYVPINPDYTYEEKMTMKTNKTNALYYAGFTAYDIDQHVISATYIMSVPNTLTALARDLNNGDMVVYLNNISNWSTSPLNPSFPDIYKGFIFWNYQDSQGNIYPEETYSRNIFSPVFEFSGINKTNHMITLTSPWNHGTFKAGTKVSQSNDGLAANYGLRLYQSISTNFTTYSNTINGLDHTYDSYHTFPYGSRYIRLILSTDSSSIGGVITDIKSVVFRKVVK
ncbi:MAG TPA: hypothetical protein IAB58_03530, partial [Candidatus Pelethosoma merdigallinarum]|nr:hypothetical protein [Candidatus Pelethosoma merdigallinarum]